MLLNGTILLVLPSPTQPDMETVVRAPKDVEPPIKRSRRSGSVGAGSRAGSVWGSEYGGSDGDPEEMEVLGMLEPTRDDLVANAAPSPSIPASGTNPPDSPRMADDADGTTLAPSTSPSSSKVKAHARRKSVGGESVKSRMKAKPKAAAKVPGPRIVLQTEDDGEESEAVSSDASSSPSEDEDEDEEEGEETPEPSVSPSASTSTKKHKRTESSATTSEPPAKKHRRSRSGLDPEERAKLLAEKEAAKAARKAQREADREAKREAKEAERKKRIEARILKEARKEADELARMERERRGVEEVKETKRRMSVAPSEVDAEERDPKRRKLR
ncbi:hypothetical protein EXIGLDRAFT_253959 [Exidia glandulosa HHB12029]|uniref:INO80 complex subunit B-like conserved region domain-containing protein n=1 Tax=Exidia glandulosa HHB12029 TaxID=1314781 RepID=A0A165DXA4_EXIGL|nr:hypothetical protein EXIGLDRAFT_253959 [Exidia glandulosa HHB12029]